MFLSEEKNAFALNLWHYRHEVKLLSCVINSIMPSWYVHCVLHVWKTFHIKTRLSFIHIYELLERLWREIEKENSLSPCLILASHVVLAAFYSYVSKARYSFYRLCFVTSDFGIQKTKFKTLFMNWYYQSWSRNLVKVWGEKWKSFSHPIWKRNSAEWRSKKGRVFFFFFCTITLHLARV